MVKICMLCPNPLEGEFLTDEHVIPHAIGGRKKVGGFICKTCNGKSGRDWESELAKQLLVFSHLAGVKRQRGGEHPDLDVSTEDGTEWRIREDGVMFRRRPSVTEQVVGSQTVVSIQSPNLKTASNLVRKVISQHKGSAEKLQVSEPRVITTYNDKTMHFNVQFGGAMEGRSTVKSVLALLSEAGSPLGVERAHCSLALNYLLDMDAPAPFGHCHYADLVVNRPTDRLFHCVSVVGQPGLKRILGYVEYFNCARYLVHVGDGYEGDPFQLTYAIDPVAGEALELSVNFERAESMLQETLQSCGEPHDAGLAAADRAFGIVFGIHERRERERAISTALESLDLDSEPMTPERAEVLSKQFTAELGPYLEALIYRRLARPQSTDDDSKPHVGI